jgi:predicted Zn-dependent protease with MMP-like domain
LINSLWEKETIDSRKRRRNQKRRKQSNFSNNSPLGLLFVILLMMTDERFEQLVSEAIETIPEKFLRRLDNVAIVTAERPSQEQLKQNDIPPGDTLLGLYEGVPLIERGEFYGAGEILPDKITIFKEPILEEAGADEAKLKEVVRDTVWHEIAHYFGYDDHEIEVREEEGKNYST